MASNVQMAGAFREGASLARSAVCMLPWNAQYRGAEWPVSERETFVVCFLFRDGQLLAIRWRASAVGSRCSLGGPALETSWNKLPSQEARKWSTLAQRHKPFPFGGMWPGGNVEDCDGTPGGNGAHTAADVGPAPRQPHARDTSFSTAWASDKGSLVGKSPEKPGLQEKGLH